MRRLVRALVRVDNAVLKVNLVACGALLLTMVVLAGAGVFFRFVLHSSLSWSEELEAYLFVWLTCLGAAAGVKLRAHPEVRALADRLPGFTRKLVADLGDAVVIALGAIFVVYGGNMIELMGSETASSLPISMTYPYLAIPVGGALLVFHSVVRILVAHLAPFAPGEATDAAAPALAHGIPEHI
jgi:TRAP-type C4-dicarboxylate transport system permease small subunit